MRVILRDEKVTKQNFALAVRRILKTNRKVWKERYGANPVMTGKQRSTLASALLDTEDEKVVHLAILRFLKDEEETKRNHSFSWFLAVMNNYLVVKTEVKNGQTESESGRRLSKQSDSEFEDEIKKAKTRRSKRKIVR